MEVTNELISDMVRVELGKWEKDDGGVWRFKPLPGKEHKHIRFREGDGLAAAKEKVLGEMGIDRTRGKVELTYEMPEWMDVDGAVKPVPIHIVTDDDMDMFLAMRVDIHEMKLYVVPMDLTMTLEIDEFKVVPILDEFAFAEVMSKEDIEKERRRRADKVVGDSIICTQVPPEQVADSDDGPLGWVGHTYASGGFATLSAALRHYKLITNADQTERSPVTVLNPESSSSTDDNDLRVTRLTRDLFSELSREYQAEELARLREMGTCGGERAETQQTEEMVVLIDRLKKENEALQVALGQMRAKEKMIRTMGIVSLLCFVFGVATVIHSRSGARLELP